MINMSLEEKVFEKRKINYQALLEYGFKKAGDVYKYSIKIVNNLKAEIIISNGKVSGKIFDLNSHDEYILYRFNTQNGEFVNKVRISYQNILKDIADKCTTKEYFFNNQANRITKLIIDKYNSYPEFLWEKSPMHGVFRNRQNNKWFGIIMYVNQEKLDQKNKIQVEVLNVKINPDKITDLLNEKGYYPAYHMNKKYWISIILDETLPDEEIINLIIESYNNAI